MADDESTSHHSREAQITRELLESQIDARFGKITARLDAMDRALRIAEEYPTAIDKAVSHVRELHDERFRMLEQILTEQRRAEEKARDKAEESITDQLKYLERAHESRNETILTMIGEIKERMTRLEGARSGESANWGWIIGLVGVIIAALAVGARAPW